MVYLIKLTYYQLTITILFIQQNQPAGITQLNINIQSFLHILDGLACWLFAHTYVLI